jgi:formate--tetrahydrofolate ligase
MLSDIEISQKCKIKHISEIAKKIWIKSSDLEFYWDYKAKIKNSFLEKIEKNKKWKLILVTAVSPTPAWEWKTTTTIWLWDALCKIGKKSIIAIREPSLWPVMWMKWWATWGWYSQVIPMEDINLHFTWDFHAITSAHLLLSANIDNHIYFWNELNIDIKTITWKRAIDVNDRALRSFNYSFDWKKENIVINSGFTITTASEIMAIFCLAKNILDLEYRLSQIIFAYDINWNPLKVKDLDIQWAMTALLKDAIKPNIVQTLEWNPVIIHWGPFANIAHGCNSIIATKTALKLADYTVTEAWFGSDLWAEKFFDIKCKIWDIKPDLIVIVATIKSIKYNSWIKKEDSAIENTTALENGFCNLERHIENMKKYSLPVVVCLNKFSTDTNEEVALVKLKCEKLWALFEIWEWFSKGWEWMISLANKVTSILDENKENKFSFLYNYDLDIKSKIKKIVTEIYWWKWVEYSDEAEKSIEDLSKLWYDKLPICIAKTPVSFSDNPALLWSPKWFIIKVNEIKISSGAWFIVVIAWNIMTMPWLPKIPNATKIDINEDGKIFWLS